MAFTERIQTGFWIKHCAGMVKKMVEAFASTTCHLHYVDSITL